MKKRGYILLLLTAFIGTFTIQPLHPLYHTHEHHADSNHHHTIIQQEAECFIGLFNFYHKIKEQPEPYDPELIPLASEWRPVLSTFFIPSFHTPYSLRAPPFAS